MNFLKLLSNSPNFRPTNFSSEFTHNFFEYKVKEVFQLSMLKLEEKPVLLLSAVTIYPSVVGANKSLGTAAAKTFLVFFNLFFYLISVGSKYMINSKFLSLKDKKKCV